MEIDFRSVWSWTLPIWALVVLVAFLGGVLIQHPQIVSVAMRDAVHVSVATATAVPELPGMPGMPGMPGIPGLPKK